MWGKYAIKDQELKVLNIEGTEIKEIFDGKKYIETLQQANGFTLKEKELKIYYASTYKEYLLFKLAH